MELDFSCIYVKNKPFKTVNMKQLLFIIAGFLTCALFAACLQSSHAAPESAITASNKNVTIIDSRGNYKYDTSKLITWQVKAGNAWILNEGSNEVFLYVHVRSQHPVTVKQRVPLNISLVLDRSGSMSGEKINYARQAAKFLVDQLGKEDYLSIVNYDNNVEITSPSQVVKNKESLKLAIDRITDRGSTNLSGGMLEGYRQAKATKQDGYVNRVLLLTDGLANAGIVEPQKLKELVDKKYKDEGVALSTFGLGADYNEDLLTLLAEAGRANYYFIDSPDKIPTLFARELKGLLSVIAQNSMVQVSIPAGLQCEKVYGYPYEVKDGQVQIRFNDIYANDERGVLIKFKTTTPVKSSLLFNCMFRYTDAEQFETITSSLPISVTPTSDSKLYNRGQDAQVGEMLALFESTEQFDDVMLDVDKGNYAKAKTSGVRALELLKQKNKQYNSPKLEEQVRKMDVYIQSMDSISVMHESEKKMYQKANKADNYEIKKMKVR